MSFLDKLFGNDFYQYSMSSIPKEFGLCSDMDCPCNETQIPKGSGYLYISRKAVDFMRAVKTGKMPPYVIGPMPILVCEQGAKFRGINLKIAADDAKRWWNEGKAPLRPTPMI
jgi:hypothetical protein